MVLLPATMFLLVFLVGPVAVFFVYSFWTVTGFDLAPVWNLDNYRDALSDEIYRPSSSKPLPPPR